MPKPHHPRRAFRSLVIFAVVTTACPTSSPDTSGHASKPSPPSSPTTAKIPSPPPPKAPPRDPISHDNPSLLGGERGLDHLGIVVDDLPVARKAFTKLGFSNPQAGRLPNGIQNTNFYFGDSTYLELLTPYDAQKAPGVAAFLAKHRCGAMFFVLATKSYPKTAAFLRHAGFPVGRPFPGHIQAKGLSGKRTMWHTFFFADPKPFANDPFFFITYRPSLRAYLLRRLADPKVRQTSFAHKNGAMGLIATYVIASKKPKTRATYRTIALTHQRDAPLKRFHAGATVIRAGRGSIVLVQPTKKEDALHAFLKHRGDGAIFGVTIRVAHIAKTKALLDRALGAPTPIEEGLFGKSLWIAPKHAFGVWVELTEVLPTPHP